MTQQSIAKKGILINTVLIIATVVAFIVIRITNYIVEYSFENSSIYYLIDIQKYTFIALEVISAIAIVLAIVLFIKSNMKMIAFILLAVSAGVALVLALNYVVLGIVTWILSGISISQLRKVSAESEFKSGLSSGNSMHQYTTANPNNSFNNINNQNSAPTTGPAAAPAAEPAPTAEPAATPVAEPTPVVEAKLETEAETPTETPTETAAPTDKVENPINE